jgi:hypothetical protein
MTPRRLLAVCAVIALGCARDLDAAEPAGRPCDSDEECNALPDGGTASCGYLRLCVSGHCEPDADGGSRVVVCPAAR